jgi:adenine/guanine phosphoribosyltransferase-like PRPP-binding protein
MKRDLIYEAFDGKVSVMVAGRRYCVNPLFDHVPATDPELVSQVCYEISEKVDFTKVDILIGEEDRGGYICALMAYIEKKPFTLTKWNPVDLQGEVSVDFRNAYTKGKLYLNGVGEYRGKKAILVEDMIDTGGTIIAMVELCRSQGLEIIDIIVVAAKTNYGGLERIVRETGITPRFLVQFYSGPEKSKVVKRGE